VHTPISALNLVKRDRYVSGPGLCSGRSFLDFVVDGVSLYDEIGQRFDLISTLWVNPPVPEEQQKAGRRLLGLERGDLRSY
jgi:hypothetical protein